MDTNADGIVTADEIDALPPPAGVGNVSGRLETAKELQAVVHVGVRISGDLNSDGKDERTLEKSVAPPLLNFRTPRL